MNLFDDVKKDAKVSACGRYRYSLTRIWGEGLLAGFIMLNPSTADAVKDDPTIKKCMGFARRWGLSGIVVANLWPFRATYPADLQAAQSELRSGPIDFDLQEIFAPLERFDRFIAAWGTHEISDIESRVTIVKRFASHTGRRLHCLNGRCKDGSPRHPVRVGYAAAVNVWHDPAEVAA